MPHQQLLKKLFQKNTTGTENVGMLQQVKNEYPYFGAAHYFLLNEMDANSPEYEKTVALTVMHFGDPLFLNYCLTKKEEDLYVVPADLKVAEGNHIQEEIKETQQEDIVQLPLESISLKREEPENIDELIIEPLYASDYFASQGIKLSEEAQPTDKLGKQLKSFTEWLKTMKKVHDSKLPEGNEQFDATVQRLAEKSNKEDEVVTEAMADAYLQQGKTAKAADIYLKLSLLNPAKSAFFAAKIEQLK
ncbi:MAG: hypothetical protein ABJA37_02220 [Ferruginibacter sp.]